MRINVYSQEITNVIERVHKRADTGITYYGIRLYLHSPDVLHHTPTDDDRSAITFWIPNAGRMNQHDFANILRQMAEAVDSSPTPERND